jgi:hypothetical protein
MPRVLLLLFSTRPESKPMRILPAPAELGGSARHGVIPPLAIVEQ